MNTNIKLPDGEQARLMAEFEAWRNDGASNGNGVVDNMPIPNIERGMSMGINGQKPQRLPRIPPVPVSPPVQTAPPSQAVQHGWNPAPVHDTDDHSEREFSLLELVEQNGYKIQGHSSNRLQRVITLVLQY